MNEKKRLDSLLKPLIRECTQLIPEPSDNAYAQSTVSKFGGLPYCEAGETWPICPTCKNGLTFICQLNTDDYKHRPFEKALFSFFYCWECFPWGEPDEEKGQWVIRRYTDPTSEKMGPMKKESDEEYDVRPCFATFKLAKVLPSWEGLYSVSEEVVNLCCEIDHGTEWDFYEDAVERLGCLNDYATITGGYPRWIQGEIIEKCSQCDQEMRLMAQIDSEENADIVWADAGCAYLFQCKKDPDVFHLKLQSC